MTGIFTAESLPASELDLAAVRRCPIVPVVWKGNLDEAQPKAADTQAGDEPARLKPNTTFLNNCIRQAVVENQRETALNSTKAACQALGSAARPELARANPKGEAAVRRTALSLARTQKLAACTALLREVAAEYGFSLRIDIPDEWARTEQYAVAPAEDADTAQAALSQPVSPAVSSQQGAGNSANVKLQALAALVDELDEVQAAGAQLVAQAVTSPEGRDPVRRGPAVSGRLTGAALSALGRRPAPYSATSARGELGRQSEDAPVRTDLAPEQAISTPMQSAMLAYEIEEEEASFRKGKTGKAAPVNCTQPAEQQLLGLRSDRLDGSTGRQGDMQGRLGMSEAMQSTAKRKRLDLHTDEAPQNDAQCKQLRPYAADVKVEDGNDIAPVDVHSVAQPTLAEQTRGHDDGHMALKCVHANALPEARVRRPAGLFAAAVASASRQTS